MEFTPQSMMMFSGIGILCWLMLRNRWKRRRVAEPAVRVPPLGYNANAAGRDGGLAFTGTESLGAPRDVLKWQVELHDLGRELKAELDTKLPAVRALTKQYDQAAQRLGEMIRLADEVQSRESALQAAQRLNRLGWPPDRIAQALDLTEPAVEDLIAADAEPT